MKPYVKSEDPDITVGAVCLKVMLDGATNEEALAAVKVQFPDGETKMTSIGWYRNKFRNEGYEILTARELKKAQKKRLT